MFKKHINKPLLTANEANTVIGIRICNLVVIIMKGAKTNQKRLKQEVDNISMERFSADTNWPEQVVSMESDAELASLSKIQKSIS